MNWPPFPPPFSTPGADARSRAGLSTYIVEPNFKDAFCVAHPTPRYAALLEGLPAAVVTSQVRACCGGGEVGTCCCRCRCKCSAAAAATLAQHSTAGARALPLSISHLAHLPPTPLSHPLQACLHRAVGLLAREMARSFADQGQDLPPWRTAQALLAKWQLGGATATYAYGTPGAGCSAWAAAAAGGDTAPSKFAGLDAA